MSNFIQNLSTLMHEYLNIPKDIASKIFFSILVLAIWQSFAIVFKSIVYRSIKDLPKRYLATKTTNYILRILALIAFFNIWIGFGGEIFAFLGLLSAGIAIALRDPLVNLAGWIFIIISKPFSVGDRIEIGGIKGDVIDIRTSQISLLEIGNWIAADQSSGRIIHIPNGWFLTKSLANYTQRFDFIWNEIPVLITFESDWAKAKSILSEIAKNHQTISEVDAKTSVHKASGDLLIYYKNLTSIVWTSIEPSGVQLTLRFLCKAREKRSTANKIFEDILKSFNHESDIEFAYPTQRLYYKE
ncbi:MAG: mechanosensitive ion channel family protein [Deltaproteobacteria bacterium]|jgi:small-conductance mechanosensitive channel|nr:mechanosensitive ion channel family protein [Deltaproteobacteria bacterium]